MGKIKGCSSESCEARKKKITYKETETFCAKCGNSLIYVCNDCYTQLADNPDKYCVRCLAKHEDSKDKAKKFVAGVGAGALAVVGLIFTYGKKST